MLEVVQVRFEHFLHHGLIHYNSCTGHCSKLTASCCLSTSADTAPQSHADFPFKHLKQSGYARSLYQIDSLSYWILKRKVLSVIPQRMRAAPSFGRAIEKGVTKNTSHTLGNPSMMFAGLGCNWGCIEDCVTRWMLFAKPSVRLFSYRRS